MQYCMKTAVSMLRVACLAPLVRTVDSFPRPYCTLVQEYLSKCNACIYSCLCGSLLESVQEGNGEIIYQFRQSQFCLPEFRKFSNNVFFKVFEYQVGMSARFDPHTLGLGV